MGSSRVVQNKLQLNEDKTEILLKGSALGTRIPSSLCGGQNDIRLSRAARNLAVIFNNQHALKDQVNRVDWVTWRSGGLVQCDIFISFEATKQK